MAAVVRAVDHVYMYTQYTVRIKTFAKLSEGTDTSSFEFTDMISNNMTGVYIHMLAWCTFYPSFIDVV